MDMTNPTVEEAMERLELRAGWDEAEALDTIRKHIEDQATELAKVELWAAEDARGRGIELKIANQAFADLTEASQVERAAALVTIEELQRRIEELEK
jgi:hypothetical protein